MKIGLIQPKTNAEIKSNVNVPVEENLAQLIFRQQELNAVLDAYKEINDVDKIAEFEGKLKSLQSKISEINQPVMSLSNEVVIAEERAAIIEDSKVKRIDAERIAYKEIKTKILDPEKAKFWVQIFNKDEVLKESALVERLIKNNGLNMNPVNVTKKINEIFSAEYEGYISNTSEMVASNHEYKVAQ